MQDPIFYTPQIATEPLLPEEEARHLIKVLRKEVGDSLLLTDGSGCFYRATLLSTQSKQAYVELVETLPTPLPWQHQIHLAIAPTKNLDRMEWLIEKATEIGINRFSFLHCRYSERKEIKLDRLQKIAISAMKQSQKAVLPRLQPMQSFKQFISTPPPGQLFIAHCYPGSKVLLQQAARPNQDVCVLIGPEGDFSEEEVQQALVQDFQAISLGPSRLRTETAALVACHSLHLL